MDIRYFANKAPKSRADLKVGDTGSYTLIDKDAGDDVHEGNSENYFCRVVEITEDDIIFQIQFYSSPLSLNYLEANWIVNLHFN